MPESLEIKVPVSEIFCKGLDFAAREMVGRKKEKVSSGKKSSVLMLGGFL